MGTKTKIGIASIGAAMLTLCVAATVPAAGSPHRTPGLTLSTFEHKGTHGYKIGVGELQEGGFASLAGVTASRRALQATYEVPEDLVPGIQATFGSLGRVAVRFERRSREVESPEKGCRMITERGIFHGAFSFNGEGGYTAAAATDPKGEVLRLPNGFCGFGDDRRARLPLPPGLRWTALGTRALTDRGLVAFQASRLLPAKSADFEASLREHVGAMTISRLAHVRGGKSAFVISGGNSRPQRVSVRPPAPFAGSASFRKPSGGPPTWTGSLSVLLPGAPDTALTGDGFAARFCPNAPLLSPCWPTAPVAGGANSPTRQDSGSQSQAFWDARLSWSR